jgi:RNA polymerase sigma factor (TIGR02999 family)
MRRILVDRARARKAGKRGGDAVTIALDDANGVLAEPDINVLELDEALTAFEALDPRAAEVFALRAFSGCSMKEASECLGVSLSSVERDWRTAKAWLKLQLARTQV